MAIKYVKNGYGSYSPALTLEIAKKCLIFVLWTSYPFWFFRLSLFGWFFLLLWLLYGMHVGISYLYGQEELDKTLSFAELRELKRQTDRLSRNVKKALLSTLTLDKMKTSTSIMVPDVEVKILKDTVVVTIEKLSGMHEVAIDHLAEDVTSSFDREFAGYEVISSRVIEGGNAFEFVLEDISKNRVWQPSSLDELIVPSHTLKLQEGLEINLADQPHLIVWGRSGSGKSTLLLSLVIQLFGQGADVRFVDGKAEFSSFKSFYSEDKIAVNSGEILEMLAGVCRLIQSRQTEVDQGVRKYQRLGIRAYDLGMQPIVVVADEIGSVVAGMDAKQKKELMGCFAQIAQKGRSVSVFLLVGTQSPKADILPTEIRGQFATKILLGSASAENQRMAFDGEVATRGEIEKFRGYYILDGQNIQPLKFFVTDMHAHGLNELAVFRKAYEIGSKR